MNKTLSPLAKLQIAFLTQKRYLQKVLQPYGITLKQAFVLKQLEQAGYLHPSNIASILFSDRPTTTVILRNMARKGWLQLQRDPQDRRQTRVSMTVKGQNKLAQIQKTPWGSPNPEDEPLACFNEGELQEFDRLLTKLNRHLRQVSAGEGKELTN